jgi:DivIVA domain-containing protein
MAQLNQLFKIHPNEIRQKSFSRKNWGGGLNPDEVSEYLQNLASDWQELASDNALLLSKREELEHRLHEYEGELLRLKGLEKTLLSVLDECQHTRQQTIEGAKHEAELIVQKSEAQAKEILAEAKLRAKSILDETELMCRKKIAAMHHQLQGMQQEYYQLDKQSRLIVEELHSAVNGAQDRIGRLSFIQNAPFFRSPELNDPDAFLYQRAANTPPYAPPKAAAGNPTPTTPSKPPVTGTSKPTNTPAPKDQQGDPIEFPDNFAPKNILEKIQYENYLKSKKNQ